MDVSGPFRAHGWSISPLRCSMPSRPRSVRSSFRISSCAQSSSSSSQSAARSSGSTFGSLRRKPAGERRKTGSGLRRKGKGGSARCSRQRRTVRTAPGARLTETQLFRTGSAYTARPGSPTIQRISRRGCEPGHRAASGSCFYSKKCKYTVIRLPHLQIDLCGSVVIHNSDRLRLRAEIAQHIRFAQWKSYACCRKRSAFENASPAI